MPDVTEPKEAPPETRERRMFWVLRDGTVTQSEGWSCAPLNPGYWWFPRLGVSGLAGAHCFEQYDAAVIAARAWIAEQREKLSRLEARL